MGPRKVTTVVVGGLVTLAVLYVVLGTKRLELSEQKGAVSACVASGLGRSECERRVEEHSARCFQLTYTAGSRRQGRAEFMDADGYRACTASESVDEWWNARSMLLRDARKLDEGSRNP